MRCAVIATPGVELQEKSQKRFALLILRGCRQRLLDPSLRAAKLVGGGGGRHRRLAAQGGENVEPHQRDIADHRFIKQPRQPRGLDQPLSGALANPFG